VNHGERWLTLKVAGAIVLGVIIIAAIQMIRGVLVEGPIVAEGLVAVCVFLGLTLTLQSALALLITVPIWLMGRRRVTWGMLDHILIVAPWAAWAVLMLVGGSEKSFMNMLVECLMVAVAVPASALLRLAVGQHIRQAYAAGGSLALAIVVAGAVWSRVPFLGE